MNDKILEKRIFHDWAWIRIRSREFWAGQIVCRLVGHRVPRDASNPWCGRCGIALEEIYGLKFYNHYTVIPKAGAGTESLEGER